MGPYDRTPREVRLVLGSRGSHSAALANHHAFMFDSARSLLAFPCTLRNAPDQPEAEPWWWGEFAFQGVLAFEVTIDNGFVEKGRITHVEENLDDLWDAPWARTVRRALLVGDILHTVSEGMIKAHDAETMVEVSSLELPTDNEPLEGTVIRVLLGAEPQVDEMMGMGATVDEITGPAGVLDSVMTPAGSLGMMLRHAIEARR